MFALDLVRDLVGEEAADHRRDRRHQHDAADDDAEPGGDGEQPSHGIDRPMRRSAEGRLGRSAAGIDEMHDQAFEHDPHHHNQRERKANALPQHRAQRGCEQLGYRLDRIVEHVCASLRRLAFRSSRNICPAAAVEAMCARTLGRTDHIETPAASVVESMPSLSRRSLLAASAALAAGPAFAAVAPSGGPLDVIIIGAGAAGIAAARRLAAAGRRYLVIEATDHVGGRCITDTTSFAVPFDRGAHWIYLPDTNPLIKVAPRRADIYPASLSQKIRIGRRYAREGELEDLLSAQVRATRAIGEAARKADLACAQAMPGDLGDWRATIEFVLGPYNCGKDLAQVSSLDFAKAAERRSAAFCKPGFGALLASLAQGLAIQLSTPASAI